MPEGRIFKIARDEIPAVDSDFIENSLISVVSVVDDIFSARQSELCYEDIFQLTRQLCVYHQEERLFSAVVEHLKSNIIKHVELLILSLNDKTDAILCSVDSFWTKIHRNILTVSSLLVYLNERDRTKNLITYSIEIISGQFNEKENEKGYISKIYSAVLRYIETYRNEQLVSLTAATGDMEIEQGSECSVDSCTVSKVTNIVKMVDILGYYEGFEKEYFAANESFYRTFSYSLLLNSTAAAYVASLERIVAIEYDICDVFLRHRSRSSVKKQTLQACLQLYTQEILNKGLGCLLDGGDVTHLRSLYQFFEVIGELELLKKAICQHISEQEDLVKGDADITELVSVIKQYRLYVEECFDSNKAFALDTKSAIMDIVNKNVDRCAEKMVLWIDHLVRLAHTGNMTLPADVPQDVMLVFGLMNQKESFEALYRKSLYYHLLDFGDILLVGETDIIDEMKSVCGNVFVQRLDALAKDSLSSTEFTQMLSAMKFDDEVFRNSTFHILSKDSAVKQVNYDAVLPVEVLSLRDEFERVYNSRYNSRILQFAYDESRYVVTYTANQITIDLRVNFHQLLVLYAFNNISSLTIASLVETTHLHPTLIAAAVRQLAQPDCGPILCCGSVDVTDPSEDTVVTLNPTPIFMQPIIDLVPPVLLSVRTPSALPMQDITNMHKSKADAAIIRIMKKAKFMSFADLVGQLSTVLNFVPDDDFVRERVESLINKDYIDRNEKDQNILEYQP